MDVDVAKYTNVDHVKKPFKVGYVEICKSDIYNLAKCLKRTSLRNHLQLFTPWVMVWEEVEGVARDVDVTKFITVDQVRSYLSDIPEKDENIIN